MTLEGELAHRASLMPVAPPCHPSLCDKALTPHSRGLAGRTDALTRPRACEGLAAHQAKPGLGLVDV